jgi:hypothetical protein
MSNGFDELMWDFLPDKPCGNTVAEMDEELNRRKFDPLGLGINKRLRGDNTLKPDELLSDENQLERFASNPEKNDLFEEPEKDWLRKLFAKNRERLRSEKMKTEHALRHFNKAAEHHMNMAQIHSEISDEHESQVDKGAVHYARLAALHKSAAEHHIQMKKHCQDMAKQLRHGEIEDAPGEVQTNSSAFNSHDFHGVAADRFAKDFGLEPMPGISAVGTLTDPAKLANKIVLRPGQELPDPFEKVASGESDFLPGFPAF